MSRTKEGEGAGRGIDPQFTEAPAPSKVEPTKPRRPKREPVALSLAPKGLGTLASPVQTPSPNRPVQLMPAELELMTPFQRRVAELFEKAADLAHRCGYVWTCSTQDIVSHVEGYLREHPDLSAMGHQVVLDTMQSWLSKIEARANGNPGTPEIPVSPKASLNTYLGNTVRFERDRKAAPPTRFNGAQNGTGGPGQPPKPSGRAIGANHGGGYGQPPPPPAPAAPEAPSDWSDKQDAIARMRAQHEERKAAKAKAQAEEDARMSGYRVRL